MQKNSSSKLLIGIIGFLILLIIGGGGAAFWYLSKTPSSTGNMQTQKQDATSEENSLAEVGPLYPLKPITVNLRNQDEKDVYLKVTLSLELSNKLLANELDAKNAVIRDEIIRILSAKTPADIDSELEKDKLCNTIKASLNAILTDGKIRNVYIVNMVIQ